MSTMLSQYNTTVTDHTTLKNQVWFSSYNHASHHPTLYYLLVLAYKFQFNKNVGECILHSTYKNVIPVYWDSDDFFTSLRNNFNPTFQLHFGNLHQGMIPENIIPWWRLYQSVIEMFLLSHCIPRQYNDVLETYHVIYYLSWRYIMRLYKGQTIYMKEKYIECNILSLMQITIGYKNMRHEHKRVTISGGAFTKRQDPTGYSVTIHFSWLWN